MSDQSAARVAADSLGLHVLQEIVEQFMQLPGYSSLTGAQQQVHIDRLDKTVRRLIAEALGVIFSAEYPAVTATLGRMSIGKGIVGSFDVDRTAESRHELMDRAGQKVVIVMADPDRYYQRMTEVKASSDQGDLFHDPSQPLGHMGVEEPPKKEDETAPPVDGAGGDSGLDDALPPSPADDSPVDIVDADTVWAALQAIGPRVEIFGEGLGFWTESELHDAMVWALAARQFSAEGKELPPLPDSIAGRLSLFANSASSPPPTPEEPIPSVDDIVGITASLKGRGIKITGKAVAKWSQSQRIAAVSWLAGRSGHRPEFIPEPQEGSSAEGT